MSWNPSVYLAFADERTRPAAELLARVPSEHPGRVADLGCGPGNSTDLLVKRWPDAKIEGVDSSPAMIETAKKSDVKAQFTLADITAWTPDIAYDVIFSNATYQWLPDHAVLLPRLMRFVAKGGVFAFQVPNNQYAPSHTLMRDVAAQGPWAQTLADVRGIFVEKAQTYFDILAPHATAVDPGPPNICMCWTARTPCSNGSAAQACALISMRWTMTSARVSPPRTRRG
jgi:trans-aconitate 2-methyltransferase